MDKKKREQLIKIIKIILVILGISLIGITFIPSFSVITYSSTINYPLDNITLVGDYKILYKGVDDILDHQASLYICPKNTTYPDNYGAGCSWLLKNTGTAYYDIIQNVTIVFNEDNFEVTEKGIYFFGKRLY